MRKKSQASFEYLFLLGIILVISVPLYIFSLKTAGESFNSNLVVDALESVASAADDLNGLGPGNKKVVKIYLPEGIDGFYITNEEIIYSLNNENISAKIYTTVLGKMPINEGFHSVRVRSISEGTIVLGDWLRINEINPSCTVFPPNPNRESRVDITGSGFEEEVKLYINDEILGEEYVGFQDFEWIKLYLTTGVFSGNANGKTYTVVAENPSGEMSNSESFIIKSHVC